MSLLNRSGLLLEDEREIEKSKVPRENMIGPVPPISVTLRERKRQKSRQNPGFLCMYASVVGKNSLCAVAGGIIYCSEQRSTDIPEREKAKKV